MPAAWMGERVTITTGIGTFTGRLVGFNAVRHDVTLSLDAGKDGPPTRLIVASDHIVTKA